MKAILIIELFSLISITVHALVPCYEGHTYGIIRTKLNVFLTQKFYNNNYQNINVVESRIINLLKDINRVTLEKLGIHLYFDKINFVKWVSGQAVGFKCDGYVMAHLYYELKAVYAHLVNDPNVIQNVIFDDCGYTEIFACTQMSQHCISGNIMLICANDNVLSTVTFLHEFAHGFGVSHVYEDINELMNDNYFPHNPLLVKTYTDKYYVMTKICISIRQKMIYHPKCLPFYPERFSEPIKL